MPTTDTEPGGAVVYGEDELEGVVYELFTDLLRELTSYRGGEDEDNTVAKRRRADTLAYLTLAENAFSELVDARNAEFDELARKLIKQHKERNDNQ